MNNRSRAYIGLGSNLDSPLRQIVDAMDEIAALPGIALVARSSLYRSAPIGYCAQPDFINAVVAADCTLEPLQLLHSLQAIEQRHGRRRERRDGPRTLDLDLLVHGACRCATEELVLPHPRAHLRAFVLLPLLEIAPDCIIPGRGQAAGWLPHCGDQEVLRLQTPHSTQSPEWRTAPAPTMAPLP